MSTNPLGKKDYTHFPNEMSRRQFLYLMSLGLSSAAVSAFLASCNAATPEAATQAPPAPTAVSQPTAAPTVVPPTAAPTVPQPTAAPAGVSPRKGGTLVYGIHNELQPLDDYTSWFPEIGYSDVYEYLTAIDPKTGNLVPSLAESFDVSADGLTLTFKLRNDKKFHNGDPFNAKAVKDLIDFWMTPDSNFPEAYYKNVASVDAPDDFTVVFHMKITDSQALWGTAYSFSPMEDLAVKKANRDKWGKSIVIGTGPYKFVSWEGDTAISARSDDYTGGPAFMQNKGLGYLDGIKYVWLPDQSTRAINLQAGDFDIIEQPAPQDVARLEADPNLVVLKAPQISILYLGFNFKTPVLQDHAVREAIYRSVDRKTIIDKVLFGQAVPAYSPVPSFDAAYWKDAETTYPFDLDKAKSLLDGAGWTMGSSGVREKDGKPLELGLIVLSNSEQTTIAQVIQQQVAQIGVKLDLQVLDKGTHQQKLLDGSSPMHFFEYVYDSPIAVLKILYDTKYFAPNGANWSFYSNPEADKWFESFNTTTDPAQRIQAIMNVQKVLVQDVANVPIYNPLEIHAMRKWVMGWVPNPYVIYSLHNDLWVTADSPRANG